MCHRQEIKFCHFEMISVWHCLQSLSQWTSWSLQIAGHPPHFNLLNADHPPKTRGSGTTQKSRHSVVYLHFRFYCFWSSPRFVLCTLSCWGWRGQKGQHICLEHTSKTICSKCTCGVVAATRAIHHLSTQQADVKPFSPFAQSVLF